MFLTHTKDLPRDVLPWGTLQWLASAKLLPGAEQTLGLCEILPGQKNPRHYHPNCEELLYVISGRGRHSLDDEWLELEAGSTIRVPVGVKHQLINVGPESLHCFIAFSTGDRQAVFLE